MRLLIVSNRLPVTAGAKDGKLVFSESSGGLVSGLSTYIDSLKTSSVIQSDYLWIGWPGATIPASLQTKMEVELLTRFRAVPVSLSEEAMDKFYHGFCNQTLWGLCHYFPSHVVYNQEFWEQYKQVNQAFCDAVLKLAKPDDVVWVHDYHLMLLPKLLRDKMPRLQIGFFFHIPFPSSEIFRLLPREWRTEILEGMLGADLVGFHTHDYTQYFLRCVSRILGYEHDLGRIHLKDRTVKADTFPMGIDFKHFQQGGQDPEVKAEGEALKKTLAGFKVILSVDRLDYSKGILNRLRGYELFLKNHPEWHEKVVLAAVVVPSRIGVIHYQQMKREIDELVGEVNGKFGSLSWTPILYQYKSLQFPALSALYGASHAALVTPLRDGMNLVAKEYVASRIDRTGVLILSEMAGAAKEMGEAIIINPNHVAEIESAILEALEMPVEEQIRRNQIMQTRLKRYDVVRWANDFLQSLQYIREERRQLKTIRLDPGADEPLMAEFESADKRLIFLDYDGTLTPFSANPQMARPDEKLLKLLKNLAGDPSMKVVVMSGRDQTTLENWLGSLPIGLVAEHGAWTKEEDGKWFVSKPLSAEWKTEILPILEAYADRLPGAFVEEKDFSVSWHYRKADPELAQRRAQELLDDLVQFTANIPVQITRGNKVVEVRSAGVDKGSAAGYWLQKDKFGFILAIGDDWTDEDMFKALPENAWSVKVGAGPTRARFRLRDYGEVHELLNSLALREKSLR